MEFWVVPKVIENDLEISLSYLRTIYPLLLGHLYFFLLTSVEGLSKINLPFKENQL